MPEIMTTPDPQPLHDQLEALRARVRELEEALGVRSGQAGSPAPAVSAASANALSVSNPFFPYQFVFQETEEGVAALGEQHEIRYCNQRLTTMLHAPYAELLDRPFSQIVVPRHQTRLAEFLAPGQLKDRIDVALVTGDNRQLPVHLVKRPYVVNGGRTLPLVVTATVQENKVHPPVPRQSFSEFFQLSPVALYLSRLDDGRLLEVNDRFLQLTGYRRAQVINKSGLELGLWPSAAERATVVDCLRKGHTVHHFAGRLHTQRGRWRHVLLSASVLVRDGEHFMIGMLEDVTERKREQGVASFQAQLLANVQDAVIATDLDLNITYWNPGAEGIYGWKAERALGKKLQHVVRSDQSPQKRSEALRLVKEAGRIFTPDMIHHRSDGAPLHIEATVVAIRGEDGEIQGFAGSYRDITERQRAEEALRKSEEKFAKLFQVNPTAMGLTTREGVELDVNDSLLRLLGYRREDFVGRNVLELDLWPNLIVAARIGVMIAAGQPVRDVQVQWRTRTGEIKDVSLSVEPIEISGKTRLLGMATDITERKRSEAERERAELEIRALNADLERRVAERTAELERSNQALKTEIAERKSEIVARVQAQQALTEAMQRLQAHADNSPLAVIDFDPDYRVTSWSAGAERMFGWSAREVLGRRIADLHWVYEEDAERVAALGREMRAGRQPRNVHTNRNYRKDGTLVDCEWYNSALLDASGNLVSVRSQVLDITERKQVKEEIEALNRHLEQRAVQLERTNQELESFSYSVSHDLRTPLASIRKFSRTLQEEYHPQLPDTAQRYLDLIHSNAQQMEELIQSLLSLSRLSRHPLKKQIVNMTALVREALETLQKETQRPDITLVVQDLPEAEADPVLLKQVWVNLIANALKFTRHREKGRIEIGYEVTGSGFQVPTSSVQITGATEAPVHSETPPLGPFPSLGPRGSSGPEGQDQGAGSEGKPKTPSSSPIPQGHPLEGGPRPSGEGTRWRGAETVYYVRDNGVGFEMKGAERLFGVFQRLHSEEEYEGTGVGLAIVARIVTRHGGRVWAEGEVDKGATFYFTL